MKNLFVYDMLNIGNRTEEPLEQKKISLNYLALLKKQHIFQNGYNKDDKINKRISVIYKE